jgi:hypothetical protein
MKTLPSFAAAMVALSLLGSGCLWRDRSASRESVTPQTPPATSAMWAEANGIVALDQQPGRRVVISSVILENNGWLVVHKDSGGKLGPVIGETYLTAGEHSQVTVTLREATINGMTYYAMLHRDDDDDRVFNISQDTPVQSTVLGGAIMASFEADAKAGDLPIVSP